MQDQDGQNKTILPVLLYVCGSCSIILVYGLGLSDINYFKDIGLAVNTGKLSTWK